MKHRIKRLIWVVASVLGWAVLPTLGLGQDTSLTLEQALEIARRRAPVILAARARIEEARARLKGASVLLRENPTIETEAGPRISNPERFTDVDVSLTQELELGGRRKARIAGAQAGIARETADSEGAARRLLREVAAAFSRALAAQERIALLTTTEKLAEEFQQIAEHRSRAGDIAILEVNLARTSVARTRAELHVADAELSAELGELRVLLGMKTGESRKVMGELQAHAVYDAATLAEGALNARPDFKALQADLGEAEAEVRLGEGFKWPDLGFTTLAAAVIAVIGASLVLALTLVPVVSGLVLRPRPAGTPEDVWLVRQLKRIYAPALDWCMQWPKTVVLLSVLVTAPTIFAGVYVGSDFMPKLDEGAFLIQTVLPPEASLDQVDRVNHQFEDALREFPEVEDVVRRSGRAERTEDPMPHTMSDVLVVLKANRSRSGEILETAMRERLANVPSAAVLFTTPLGMRVDEGLGGTRRTSMYGYSVRT